MFCVPYKFVNIILKPLKCFGTYCELHFAFKMTKISLSRYLKSGFSQNLPYDPTSKFQELVIGSGLIFMQSEIKICKTDSLQTKNM